MHCVDVLHPVVSGPPDQDRASNSAVGGIDWPVSDGLGAAGRFGVGLARTLHLVVMSGTSWCGGDLASPAWPASIASSLQNFPNNPG